MPQMMPMYWMFLMIYFLMIFIFFNLLIYYCYMNLNFFGKLINKNKLILNKLILNQMC